MNKPRPPGAEQAKAKPLAPNPPAQTQLLRLREVERLTGIKSTQIYYLQKIGKFPKRIKLSERAAAYLAHEIEQWIADRIADSRPESRNGR